MSYNIVAEKLKVIGHPDRLRLLEKIMEEGCNVTEIQKRISLPQATVSGHLALLKRVGIVESCRKGNIVCYKVIDELTLQILKIIKEEENG